MKLADWLGVSYKAEAGTRNRQGVRVRGGFNAIPKRGIVGVFHYVSPKHLHRYAAETAFLWNERAGDVLDNLSMLVRLSRLPLAYGPLTA